VTGPRDPRDEPEDTFGTDDDLSWPSRDLSERDAQAEEGPDAAAFDGPVVPEEGVPVDGGAPQIWDTRRFGDRRRATTAEQAVPWLVGLVLALAGIVIVLIALIYSDANGGFSGGVSSQSLAPSSSLEPSMVASGIPGGSPSQAATPSATPTPAPTPAPTYGALEMMYLARPTAFGASELFRNDFATATAPTVVAKSTRDLAHFAVAPDGTVAVAIVDRKLLALTPGKASRTLADNIDAVTFGSDASTVYAVTITRGGANDDAKIVSIGFGSGTTTTLTTVNFAHPASPQRSSLDSARFFDEGGMDRLYATSDGNVVFWVAGAGQWQVDPASGNAIPVTRQPVLWSPDGTRRIAITENGAISTLAVVDGTGATISRVQVTGLTSHLRWSPGGDEVVFTLGLNSSGGGVRMDLAVWDLVNGKKPHQLTANGASFGAEWLGVAQFWQP